MADFNININADVTDDNNILGETVAIGDLLYLSSNSKWYKTDASLPSKSTTELRLALEAGVLDDTISMLVYGYHTFGSFVVSPGTKYWVSATTPGEITTQVYLNSTNTVRYIGTGYDATTILFNPDQTWIGDDAREINGVPINISHTHVEVDITDLDKYTQAEVDALIATATDNNYAHNQAVANTVWTIAHNLGKFPCVQVFDDSGNNVEGEISHTDNNNLTITFNTAFAGDAYLN